MRRRWHRVERALRVHEETTGSPRNGWDKPAPQQPTAVLLMTEWAAVLGVQVGAYRPLAQPWSAVHLSALSA